MEEEEDENNKRKKTHPWNTGQRQDAMHHCRESALGYGSKFTGSGGHFFLASCPSFFSSYVWCPLVARCPQGVGVQLNFVRNEHIRVHASRIFMRMSLYATCREQCVKNLVSLQTRYYMNENFLDDLKDCLHTV